MCTKIKKISSLFALLCLLNGCNDTEMLHKVDNLTVEGDNVYYHMKGLEKPFNVLFLADTHFTVEDERGKDYYPYSRRMGGAAVEPENYGKGNGRDRALTASLERAKKADAELVILGGDILNFPSEASVEYVRKILDNSGLKWTYIAGNHDWHYEGEPGDAMSQREKWTHSHLKPLYQGRNPMCYAEIIHGINFVTIDNSLFEITEGQLDFFKKEVHRGLPVLLFMHIPIYLQKHNIDYGCGSPYWKKENDIYYQIERREPWPENGFGPITHAFRNCVLNSPEVVGIYAGHVHSKAIDFVNGKIQYVVEANYNYKDVLIHFVPSEEQ